MATTCTDFFTIAQDQFLLTPAEIAISVLSGTDTTFEAILLDGEGEAIDISADTVVLTVRDALGGTLKIQKTNAPSGHVDPTSGSTSFSVLATDVPDISPAEFQNWVYEIRRVQASGDESVHIQGAFLVEPAVGG